MTRTISTTSPRILANDILDENILFFFYNLVYCIAPLCAPFIALIFLAVSFWTTVIVQLK